MGVEADFSELHNLASDLGAITEKTAPKVRAVLAKSSLEIKKSWQANAAGPSGRRLSAYVRSISYDATGDKAGEMSSEIGPDRGRKQGQFGFVEDANGGVRGRPQHAGRKALAEHEDRIVEELGKAVGDILD